MICGPGRARRPLPNSRDPPPARPWSADKGGRYMPASPASSPTVRILRKPLAKLPYGARMGRESVTECGATSSRAKSPPDAGAQSPAPRKPSSVSPLHRRLLDFVDKTRRPQGDRPLRCSRTRHPKPTPRQSAPRITTPSLISAICACRRLDTRHTFP